MHGTNNPGVYSPKWLNLEEWVRSLDELPGLDDENCRILDNLRRSYPLYVKDKA